MNRPAHLFGALPQLLLCYTVPRTQSLLNTKRLSIGTEMNLHHNNLTCSSLAKLARKLGVTIDTTVLGTIVSKLYKKNKLSACKHTALHNSCSSKAIRTITPNCYHQALEETAPGLAMCNTLLDHTKVQNITPGQHRSSACCQANTHLWLLLQLHSRAPATCT
jgi:hypothetical protein